MKTPMIVVALALAGSLLPSIGLQAGEVEIVKAEAYPLEKDLWRFDVTLRHGDTGWDHYANQWDVVGPDGTVLGVRKLLHPHVNEQPFTRSLVGVVIPEAIEEVTIRAHDSVHGIAQNGLIVKLRR